MKLQSL